MLHLYLLRQQRCVLSLARFCQTQARGPVSPLTEIKESDLDKDLYEGNIKSTDVNSNYFKEKSTDESVKISAPANSSSSGTIPCPDSQLSYTHTASGKTQTSSLLTQSQIDKTVFSDISYKKQLLNLAVPFDEVPGPKILKLAAKVYSYLPLLSTHITSTAMNYFLKMLGECVIMNSSLIMIFNILFILILHCTVLYYYIHFTP